MFLFEAQPMRTNTSIKADDLSTQKSGSVPSAPFKDAETSTDLLIKLRNYYPHDHVFPHILGEKLWENSEYEHAVDAYEQSLQLNPENALVTAEEQIHHAKSDNCRDCGETTGVHHRCVECYSLFLCQACYDKPVRFSHEEGQEHRWMRIPREGWKLNPS